MHKEPEDLGRKVEGVDSICDSCPFTEPPFSEHVLSDCKLEKYDCIHRAKIFYDIFYASVFPEGVIIPVEELRDFIPAQL